MKIQTLEFGRGSSVGNTSVYAAPQEWVWTADGAGISGAYNDKGYPKRDSLFFGVGWLVRISRDTTRPDIKWDRRVDLWVDSPRERDNATLNTLKRELVKGLMDSDLRRAIVAGGYQCEESQLRRSDRQMRLTRTTTVFKVLLPDMAANASPEVNIATVHAGLGQSVSQVLSQFATRLDEHFSSESRGVSGYADEDHN